MTGDELRQRVANLNMWQRGDERAPHKPLLLLMALGRASRGEEREVQYDELADRLRTLLIEFGPPRQAYHPEYPFWHLQSDGLWRVVQEDGTEIPSAGGQPPVAELRRVGARGGLPIDVYDAVRADLVLLQDLARTLLADNFADTLHEDIATAVGLELEGGVRQARDPTFRNRVLVAYGYSCAVCGYDLRLGHAPLAIEAAHIKWHQAGGPPVEVNGLALCSMHHKLFDRGAMTLGEDRRIVVSNLVNGSTGFDSWLGQYNGRPLRRPQSQDYVPLEEYVRWHVREVFRGERRDMY